MQRKSKRSDRSAAPAPGSLAALLAERDALREQLADARRQLAHAERRPWLDDVLCYVGLVGFKEEAARASGINKNVWERDVQLRWHLVKARYGERQRTRLMWACERGSVQRAAQLLDWKSDIEARDADGNTPLHIASAAGHGEVVRELLRRGAKVDAVNKRGDSPLHVAGHSCCHRSLDDDHDEDDEAYNSTFSPIPCGRVEVVRLLLERGAALEAENAASETPLYSATCKEVTRELIKRGANMDARDENGDSMLISSTVKFGADKIRELVAHGAVDIPGTDGYTALLTACRDGSVCIARELLKSHKPALDVQGVDGSSPLILAVRDGEVEIIAQIISLGANLNLRDESGRSALDYAERYLQFSRRMTNHPPTKAYREKLRALAALMKSMGAT